jgi:hypothetical protein
LRHTPRPRHPLALTAKPRPPPFAQGLALLHSAAWLLPALLDGGAAALPALARLELELSGEQPVAQRLFEERGLLARLTRLKVHDWRRLPPLPGAPYPEDCPGGMRMEDLEVRGSGPPTLAADAVALAAWPMPRLRRLVFSEVNPAALRTLLRAPWPAGLEDLDLSGACLQATEGARGGQGAVSVLREAGQGEHACTHLRKARAPRTPCLRAQPCPASNPAPCPQLPLAPQAPTSWRARR